MRQRAQQMVYPTHEEGRHNGAFGRKLLAEWNDGRRAHATSEAARSPAALAALVLAMVGAGQALDAYRLCHTIIGRGGDE